MDHNFKKLSKLKEIKVVTGLNGIYSFTFVVVSYIVLSREELGHMCSQEGKDSRGRERLQRWKGWCSLFVSQEVT